jgi:hypothetical protein
LFCGRSDKRLSEGLLLPEHQFDIATNIGLQDQKNDNGNCMEPCVPEALPVDEGGYNDS